MRVVSPQNGNLTTKPVRDQRSLAKPAWMRIRPPTSDSFADIKRLLKEKKLNTVCVEARCPNISECWSGDGESGGTATFMVMGDTCTRACRFCMVKSGNPRGVLDADEPRNLVEAVGIMKLDYVVLTCVTRDDLADGGAQHWADCLGALKKAYPGLIIELLISDLNGNLDALKKIVDSGPNVLGHNLETVERLQGAVRDPRAGYGKSLDILRCAKRFGAPYTKTSLMLGLGETEKEVVQAMKDARAVDVDIITFGQYLRPSPFHLPVKEYVKPARFDGYKNLAKEMGFLYYASGPFVRSSYRAGEQFMKNVISKDVSGKI